MEFSTYNYEISRFVFVKIGFFVAVIFPTLLLFLYPIAKNRPRSWAKRFIVFCSVGFVGGGALAIVYAIASGEWPAFMMSMGAGVIFELGMLAVLYFLAMWFMAMRTAMSLPASPPSATQDDQEN